MTKNKQVWEQVFRFSSAIVFWFLLFAVTRAVVPGDNLLLPEIGIWLTAVAISLPLVALPVPEVTGAVLLNLITGKLTPVGPGIKFKYLWESVRRYISLELVTAQRSETYPAYDGPLMLTEWSYQYEPRLSQLGAFIAVDKTTIDQGFTDVISSILSDIVGDDRPEEDGPESEWLREYVKEVEQEVIKMLEAKVITKKNGDQQSFQEKLEETYGVNFKLFSLADIDFDKDYQQARAGKARMSVVLEAARDLEGLTEDDTPSRKSVQVVLAEQGKARMNIVDVWGDADQTQKAAATLGSMLKGDN